MSENAFFQKSKNTFQISLSHKNSMWKSFILKRLRQSHFSESITKTQEKIYEKIFRPQKNKKQVGQKLPLIAVFPSVTTTALFFKNDLEILTN